MSEDSETLPEGTLISHLLELRNRLLRAGVAVLIFSEKLERPRPLGWRCRGFGTVTRIVLAQVRIRLHARRLGPAPFFPGG